jgi:soluble lytic murein transglycosylase-like protein
VGLIFSRDRDYDPLFIAAGKRHGVDPAILKGQTAVESAFNPKAIRWEPSGSNTTARPGDKDASRGLMQTTRKAALSLGWPASRPDSDQFDPATSIEWGAREIAADLADPYREHADEREAYRANAADDRPLVEKAIAAYNMGWPRSIRHTVPRIAEIYEYPMTYKTNPPAGWYFANQPYVSLVLAYAAAYRAEFAGDKAKAEQLAADVKKKGAGWATVPASWSSWYSDFSGSWPMDIPASTAAPVPAINVARPGSAAAPASPWAIASLAAAAAGVVRGCAS